MSKVIRNRRIRRLAVALWVAVAATVLASGVASAAPKAFDTLLPADTSLFVSLADYPKTAEKFRSSPYHEMVNEPEITAFVDQIVGLIADEAAELKEAYEQVGITPSDIQELLAGEVCLALGELDIANKSLEVLLAVDVSGRRQKAQEMLDKLLDAFEADMEATAVARTEESFQGKTIVRLSAQDQGDDEAVFYMLDDEVLAAAAGGRTMLEKFIASQTGSSVPSLAKAADYQRAKGRLGQNEDMTFYANIAGLLAQIPSTPAAQPGMPSMPGPKQWLDALGLMDVRSAAMTYTMVDNGSRSQGLVLVPAPRRGILKAFEPSSVDLDPPAFVAGDASMYSGVYFSASTLWREVMTALQTLSPQMHQMVQMQLASAQMGVNLENDVIFALGERWYVYQPAEAVTANPPVMMNRAFAVELAKPAAFKGAMQTMVAQLSQTPWGASMSTLEYEGATLYQFPPISPNPEMPGMEPTLALSEDMLIFAFNSALAKSIVSDSQRSSSPLLNNEDYRRASAEVLPAPHMVGFADARGSAKAQWDQMKTALSMQFGLALPGWEVLKKYQTISLTTAKWTEDGLLMKAWQPFPDTTR